jgi:hypothetical protein
VSRVPRTGRGLAAALIVLAVLAVACGSSGAPPAPTLAPGATPTASPTGGGGSNASDAPGASTDPGGPGAADPSADPSFEEASPVFGERTLDDVKLLAGQLTWDGTEDWGGMGNWDHWVVNVDLVLRRSTQHAGLVFAKGSTFTVNWDRPPRGPDDLCQLTKLHWTGDIGSVDGENWDPLSVANPLGTGGVWESAHSLTLDISIGDTHEGQWCTVPGVVLNCPLDVSTGPQALWMQTVDDPASLDYSCTDKSVMNSDAVYSVNAVGLLQEAADPPPSQ